MNISALWGSFFPGALIENRFDRMETVISLTDSDYGPFLILRNEIRHFFSAGAPEVWVFADRERVH